MATLLDLPSWASFRDLCFTRKNLNNQYTEDSTGYDLYGPDANDLTWRFRISKDSADATEFEASYKSTCNWAIGNRSYAFSTPDFQFAGDGVSAICPAGLTTSIDYKFTASTYINGGELMTQNCTFGDWVDIVVIDKDNIIGYGNDVVLSQYVKKWYIDPSRSMSIKTTYAGKIPANLYIRVNYHNVGNTDVDVAINYLIHQPL